LCFCVFSSGVRAASAVQEFGTHPIDVEFNKKIDDDPTTVGMGEATAWAYDEWDKLLNANYQALMKALDKENQELLRASQREWIKFRDLEFEFSDSFWTREGTMYAQVRLACKRDFVRERALKLGQYLEDWDDRADYKIKKDMTP
jgi:uncharacterized protein YecT (DUF1311 family)